MANDDNLTMPQKLEKANKELIGDTIEEVEIVQTVGLPELRANNSSFWQSYISAISIIFALLAVLYGGLWLMRKLGYGSAVVTSAQFSKNNLRVEAQLSLGGKRQLYLVRYMNKRLLLGTTDASISLISEEYMLDDEGKILKDFDETMQNIQKPENLLLNPDTTQDKNSDTLIAKLFSKINS